MKKQFQLTLFLFIVLITTNAQKTDTAWLMVHYKFTYVRDTNNREHPYTENVVLFVGKSASVYRSYDGLVADQQFKKAYAEAVANSPDGHISVNRRGAGSPTRYYQYAGEQKLFAKESLMMNDYLVDGTMPTIDWKISADTASFGGLHCQKATTHFKGRDYMVWFCSDLPVHTGPWKLNGLPGVIVDARDAKNEIVFAFDGVEKTIPSPVKEHSATVKADEKDTPPILRGLDEDPNLIQLPARAIKTSQKEFDKLKAAMEKDPAAFAQAVNTANSHSDGPKMDHVMVGPRGSGPVINNPIELPEK